MTSPRNAKVVTFGEVMMRLSTENFARFTQAERFRITYAGAEANVAVSLAHFGVPAVHVTRFPDNDLGHTAAASLAKFGVDTQHIVFAEGRMGVYFLENGAMQRSSRIIYDRFNSAFANMTGGEFDWSNIFKGATWFHFTGITPAISQQAAGACLAAVKEARKHGLTVSADINYRRNLWQYGKTATDVMPELIEHADLVMGGKTDILNCTGIEADSFKDACAKMKKRFPSVKKIVQTKRESVSASHNEISAQLFDGHQLIKSKSYSLTHIVDRVGAGDAFMAGLILKMLMKGSDEEALEFAIAASAFKHAVEGDYNLATIEEIETLVRGENVGKLLR